MPVRNLAFIQFTSEGVWMYDGSGSPWSGLDDGDGSGTASFSFDTTGTPPYPPAAIGLILTLVLAEVPPAELMDSAAILFTLASTESDMTATVSIGGRATIVSPNAAGSYTDFVVDTSPLIVTMGAEAHWEDTTSWNDMPPNMVFPWDPSSTGHLKRTTLLPADVYLTDVPSPEFDVGWYQEIPPGSGVFFGPKYFYGVYFGAGTGQTPGTAPGALPPGVDGDATITITEIHVEVTWHLVVAPGIGSTEGNELVEISGMGFEEGVTVDFDGIPATDVTIVDAYHLTCVTPAHPDGIVDVTVTYPGPSTEVLEEGYEYRSSKIQINPKLGGILGADPVDITNSGLPFEEGASVTFDGIDAFVVEVVDPHHITCRTPPHDEGLVTVQVANPEGGSVFTLLNGFTYQELVTSPTVSAGETAVAQGPAPSTVATNATVRRGLNNGTLTFQWVEGAGNPDVSTISDPNSLNTQITFDTYTPGVYQYKLSVSDQGGRFVGESTTSIVIPQPTPPKLTGSNQTRGATA